MSNVFSLTSDTFDGAVNQSSGTVVIDFFATWCAPCKKFAPILEQIADENVANFKVYSVDVDDNPELAERFGIKSIPTVLVFKNEKLHKLHAGMISKNALLNIVK